MRQHQIFITTPVDTTWIWSPHHGFMKNASNFAKNVEQYIFKDLVWNLLVFSLMRNLHIAYQEKCLILSIKPCRFPRLLGMLRNVAFRLSGGQDWVSVILLRALLSRNFYSSQFGWRNVKNLWSRSRTLSCDVLDTEVKCQSVISGLKDSHLNM